MRASQTERRLEGMFSYYSLPKRLIGLRLHFWTLRAAARRFVSPHLSRDRWTGPSTIRPLQVRTPVASFVPKRGRAAIDSR